MKKSLIALAAVAAFGAASAQTAPDVTLYGKIDLGVKNVTSNDPAVINQGLVAANGSYETTRYGIKGGTGIGAGLNASFQLEGAFSAADGSVTAGSMFGRVAKAAVSGSFGSVQAGLDWSPYDNAFNDALEYNGFSAMNGAWSSGGHADGGNTGNGNTKGHIQYTTPDLSGFNAVLMYAPSGDKTATTSASSYSGLGLNYANGPLTVAFAYEAKANFQNNTVTNGISTAASILTGSYDLGAAKLFAGIEQADAGITNGKDQGWEIGLSVPVGKQATVGLGYASETNAVVGLTEGKANAFGAQYVYSLTPKAAIYVGFLTKDNTAAGGATGKITTNTLASGLRYNF